MQTVYFVIFDENDDPFIHSHQVDLDQTQDGFYLDTGRLQYIVPEMICHTPEEAEQRLKFVCEELGIELPVYH